VVATALSTLAALAALAALSTLTTLAALAALAALTALLTLAALHRVLLGASFSPDNQGTSFMMAFVMRRSVLATVGASIFTADNAASSHFAALAGVFSFTEAFSHGVYKY
jgi:hypothetical protein